MFIVRLTNVLRPVPGWRDIPMYICHHKGCGGFNMLPECAATYASLDEALNAGNAVRDTYRNEARYNLITVQVMQPQDV